MKYNLISFKISGTFTAYFTEHDFVVKHNNQYDFKSPRAILDSRSSYSSS